MASRFVPTPLHVAGLCLVVISALYVVGMASGTVLRHVIQTAPLWVAVLMGGRYQPAVKWIAAPMFVLWLLIMIAIWLFLLGWARIVTGTFSAVEIAMTIVIGAACVAGLWACRGVVFPNRALAAAGIFAASAAAQLVAMKLSFIRLS